MPPEQNQTPEERLYRVVAQDLAARLRDLEKLHPRVNSLEQAVAEIRYDFREARAEQQESHRETHAALNSFRKRMDHDNRDTVNALNETATATTNAITSLTVKVEKLARKVAFAAGAIWAFLGIAGVVFAFRSEVVQVMAIAFGGK
ncbi:hypothetical protein [Marinobacter oulmenensis]|uniref:Putative RNase H-like nuclease (RuvC/YqgF family) n=1 Tax=Marinobacter oulmenensis TaxID=643747 RepID=A0A840UH44_9GAMM|nr:hypothetical protein [Marinobacter oulmenensis]MBB5320476.1 putative RNase H-like nuclease (RuvC/YqgF family) [Marinobacter oulmenensis]